MNSGTDCFQILFRIRFGLTQIQIADKLSILIKMTGWEGNNLFCQIHEVFGF